MKRSAMLIRTFLATVSLVSLGLAHVSVTAPEGGEKLAAGSTFTVKWTADDHDCVYNLYHSADSGKTWKTIVLNLAKATRQHSWTVPTQGSTKAMVRVFQDNATGSDLEGKSKVFTIQGSTGIPGAAPVAEGIWLRSGAGGLEVGFDLAQPEKVVLQAFDVRGKLVANLLEGRREAGRNVISLFSTRLQSAGPLVFKLALGDQIHVLNLAGAD